MAMLREVARDLWVTERPQTFLGLELGTRMTVIRLSDRRLFVHSPVRADDAARAEVDALGEVAFIVAPNRFHHLYAGPFAAVYPRAALYGAPGLAAKRRDVSFTGTLGDDGAAPWAGEIDQTVFRGLPILNEVVFLHRASRTLVATDLAFNVHRSDSLAVRLFLRLDGAYQRFGVGHLEKVLIRDKAAARASIDRILAWDFDRIVVAHGDIVERGGRAALRDAFAWLPPAASARA